MNDYHAEHCRAHPDRYAGMASLAFHNADEPARELERCVSKLGFKGVMANGFRQVDSEDNLVYLDDERMMPLWEALTALDIPLYIHPRPSYKSFQYDTHSELTGAAWGFAPETATHALRIVYSGIFNRFPTAKLVLGHLGESLPFLAWRIQHGINFSPNGRITKKQLAAYLAEYIWVTTSGNFSTQALHCTMLTMGADRILFCLRGLCNIGRRYCRHADGGASTTARRKSGRYQFSKMAPLHQDYFSRSSRMSTLPTLRSAVGAKKIGNGVFVHREELSLTIPVGKYSDQRPVNIGNHFVLINPYYALTYEWKAKFEVSRASAICGTRPITILLSA